MFIERLSTLLRQQGYVRLETQMQEYLLYMTGSKERSQLIEIIDLSRGFSISKEQLDTVEHNTRSAFYDQGYKNMHFFTLLVTDRPEAISGACNEIPFCWIVDLYNRDVIVATEQVEDFYGLRAVVRHALDENFAIPQNEFQMKEEDGQQTQTTDQTEQIGQTKQRTKGILRSNFTHMNFLMVSINILVFLILSFLGDPEDSSFMIEHGAMYTPSVLLDGQYYRLLTSMFLHFGVDHLFSNMIGLYFLGDNLERAVGRIRYLIIYLLSGIFAAIGSMFFYLLLREEVVSAGASGAIFGVVGAILYIVIRNRGKLEDLTTGKILIFIAFCVYSGVTSEGIDNAAHMCGLAAGFLLSVLLYRKPKNKKSVTNEGEVTGDGN